MTGNRWLATVLVCWVFGCGLARGEGSVILDRATIWVDGPVSGEIVVTIEDQVELVEFPGIRNGGVEIRIQAPGGQTRIIDKESIVPGDSGDYGRRPLQVFEPGRYIIPFCLVKGRKDDYLFGNVGVYKIEFRFPSWFPVGDYSSVVEVKNCDNCGRQGYLSQFSNARLLHPFSSASVRSEERLPTSPYGEMFDIVMSYSCGGIYPMMLFDLGNMNEKQDREIRGQLLDFAPRGIEFASVAGTNEGFWQYLMWRISRDSPQIGVGVLGQPSGSTRTFYMPMQ